MPRLAAIKTFEHADGAISVRDGRYGPYVNQGKVNATCPATRRQDVTLEQAAALIDERAAETGGGSSSGKRRPAAAPKAAAAPKLQPRRNRQRSARQKAAKTTKRRPKAIRAQAAASEYGVRNWAPGKPVPSPHIGMHRIRALGMTGGLTTTASSWTKSTQTNPPSPSQVGTSPP